MREFSESGENSEISWEESHAELIEQVISEFIRGGQSDPKLDPLTEEGRRNWSNGPYWKLEVFDYFKKGILKSWQSLGATEADVKRIIDEKITPKVIIFKKTKEGKIILKRFVGEPGSMVLKVSETLDLT